MSITIRKPPELRFDKLSERIPSFLDKQPLLDNQWRTELTRSGWGSLGLSPRRLLEEAAFGLNPVVELPPVLRVGRLAVEKSEGRIDSAEAYMIENDFPAFVTLRDGSGIAFGPHVQFSDVSKMAQMSLVHLLTLMNPSVVRVTALDIMNWGTACSLLRAAVPNLQLVTTSREKSEFFEKIREDVIKTTSLLGVRHKTLYSHNKACPDAPQPYHFVYVTSYSRDLELEEQNLILSLVRPGPEGYSAGVRAGVYFFLIFDDGVSQKTFLTCAPKTPSITLEQLEPEIIRVEINDPNGISTTTGSTHSIFEVIPDRLDDGTMEVLVERCSSHLSVRHVPPVELPLDSQGCWQASSADGLRVAIGKSGSTIVQMGLGKPEIVHNALVGGAVGTGKTILLHAIICQALREYSPDELKLSLLDYKEGTEFSVYSKAPHLFALSLGSNPKFGIDLLKEFQVEMSRRASLFKEHQGVQNLASYRAVASEKLCRHLIVIDEFQVLLNHPKLGAEAQQLLEDVIRRGRSFGFNVILSSQSLSDGALSPAIRSNLGCRICLRLSERECLDFLSPENIIASQFQYPGQAVYNNREGNRDGNIEFRVAYYEQQQICEFVSTIEQLAVDRGLSIPEKYFYNGEFPLQMALSEVTNPGALLVAVEEGIPSVNHLFSLSGSEKGSTLLIAGMGRVRDAVYNLIQAQLELLQTPGLKTLSGSEVQEYCSAVIGDPPTSVDSQLILMEVSRSMGESFEIKEACDLLTQRGQILVLFFDFAESVESLGLDLKDCPIVICCDRRSADRLSFGAASGVSESLNTAIIIRPFDDPISVRIPLIIN